MNFNIAQPCVMGINVEESCDVGGSCSVWEDLLPPGSGLEPPVLIAVSFPSRPPLPPHPLLKPEVNSGGYEYLRRLPRAWWRSWEPRSVWWLIRPFPNTCDILLLWRDQSNYQLTIADDARGVRRPSGSSFLCLGWIFFLILIYVNYILFNNVCFLLIVKIMYAHWRKYINALNRK